MKAGLLTLAIVTLMPSMGFSQAPGLRTISEYLTLPEENRDTAYPFLRCIGLFQGVYRYGGANFTEEEALRTSFSVEAMGFVSLALRQQRHPENDLDQLATQIGLEIEDMTMMYTDRLRTNYNLTGEAWGSDTVVLDDFDTCAVIAQDSVDAVGSRLDD